MTDKWTPERIEYLTSMLVAGRSPFEAATRLGGVNEVGVVEKAQELDICVPVVLTEAVMDALIDELVQEIDYDIWKESYNVETAEDPNEVESNRDTLKVIIFRNGV